MTRSTLLLTAAALILTGCGADSLDSPTSLSVATSDSGTAAVTAERITLNDDGTITSQAAISTCTTNITDSRLNAALMMGDVSVLGSPKSLHAHISNEIKCADEFEAQTKAALFGVDTDAPINSLDWDPTHDAIRMDAVPGVSFPLMRSNAVAVDGYAVTTEALAIASRAQEGRALIFGSNPMRTRYRGFDSNAQLDVLMENGVDWLAGRQATPETPLKIVTAHFMQGYYFPDRAAGADWFSRIMGDRANVTFDQTCNGAALTGCLDGADVLLISNMDAPDDIDALGATVEAALRNGIGVMYLYTDGGQSDFGDRLLSATGASRRGDNYWYKQSIVGLDGVTDYDVPSQDSVALAALTARLNTGEFPINLSLCADKTCEAESGYAEHFSSATQSIRDRMLQRDARGENLFHQSGQWLDKGLVLLADYYRQTVQFPMDKSGTDTTEFLRAMFADMVHPIVRGTNAVQADMGNFSRSDFSQVTLQNATVEMTSVQTYRAAGLYAVPGQTVRVRRLDNSDVQTHVKVNMIRTGATHEFETNGYKRPKYMTSTDLPVRAGDALEFTSAVGGPIQIRFSGSGQDVRLAFENVGKHAVWRGTDDNESFAAALDAGEFDWAELITDGFEVHSTLEKMRTTVGGEEFAGPVAVAEATEKFLSNYPHVLAGYKGSRIDVVPEIHDFAVANGLDIHDIETVKHMNADQANCGYGCSGNPYDAYWSFNPVGHGDIHELGHGLERSRFRYTGQPGHTTTNPYSYYSKRAHYRETGGVECQSLPYQSMFETLQASQNTDDPAQFMRDANLTGWSQGAAINFQLMMAVENAGLLDDGYNLLARQHVIEREFDLADNDDAAWAAKRVGLGFGDFSRTDARALSNDDWNLLALSHAVSTDLTDWLEMWGFEFSEAAKTSVAAKGWATLPRLYYAASATAQCTAFPTQSLAVDGKTIWPIVAQDRGVRVVTDTDSYTDHHKDDE